MFYTKWKRNQYFCLHRYAHQVSVAALHHLLKNAWERSKSKNQYERSEWIKEKRKSCPQFEYWYTAYELELLLLQFVRGIREARFDIYHDTLEQLVSWMFALDHVNYARWLPIHLQTLRELEVRHPQIYHQFKSGNFVVQKTHRKFSCIGVDHAHEQNNKIIKGDGGVTGILDKPDALLKWMVAGPEIAFIVQEYEDLLGRGGSASETHHHEDTPSFEKRFAKDVSSFAAVLEREGNPFEEEDGVLVTLFSKVLMNQEAIHSVKVARETGKSHYLKFKEDRCTLGKKSIHDVIKKNKFSLFRNKNSVITPKSTLKLTSIKQDCKLFASLYVVCQSRERDLKEFFSHENHAYPPFISTYGKLRQTAKSDALKMLNEYDTPEKQRPEEISSILLDGAAVVHMVPRVLPKISRHTQKTNLNYSFMDCLGRVQFKELILYSMFTEKIALKRVYERKGAQECA